MCAGAAYWTQISRIVYGAMDEKRGFSTLGSSLLQPKTVVKSGVLADDCAALMISFFEQRRD